MKNQKSTKKKNTKKKQQNQQGFTLIELLAVITIMGILMMVAIPSVSRTIENTRRGTFANTAGQYLSGVKQAIVADQIKCQHGNGTTADMASALPAGTYYVPFASVTTAITENYEGLACSTNLGTVHNNKTLVALANVNKAELLETGGQSSFGNANVYGYVKIVKDAKGKLTYTIRMGDTAGNGFSGEVNETSANSRSSVTVGGVKSSLAPAGTQYNICRFEA